jgi:hypothetical protein
MATLNTHDIHTKYNQRTRPSSPWNEGRMNEVTHTLCVDERRKATVSTLTQLTHTERFAALCESPCSLEGAH